MCLHAPLCNIDRKCQKNIFTVYRQNQIVKRQWRVLASRRNTKIHGLCFVLRKLKNLQTSLVCTSHSITHIIADNTIAVLSSRAADFCLLYQ